MVLSVVLALMLLVPSMPVRAATAKTTNFDFSFTESTSPSKNFYGVTSYGERYVQSSKDLGNFGNADTIMYFKFDIVKPEGKRRITNAYISLYLYSNNGQGRTNYLKPNLISGAWNPTTLTHNNRPKDIDVGNKSTNYEEVSKTIRVDITEVARKWIEEGMTNYGVAIYNTSTNATAWFSNPSITIQYIENTEPTITLTQPLENLYFSKLKLV